MYRYACASHKQLECSGDNIHHVQSCFLECSGVHRSLGVHHSKVRSLTLDAWEPEIIKVMAELGNAIVNKVYEANVSPNFIRATPNCDRQVKKFFSMPTIDPFDHHAFPIKIPFRVIFPGNALRVTYILDVRTPHYTCPLFDRFYLHLSQKIFWACQHRCFDGGLN
jgi:hypothetical protein